MNKNHIVQKDHPALRQKALSVSIDQITSPKIKSIITKLKRALATCEDGVAIAAPQIGESLRIFVVSGKVFSTETQTHPDQVFINPIIKKTSKIKNSLEEGCLSIRWFYGEVKRADKVSLEALNEKGQKLVYHSSGLLAQIFQHETDHLDGILFIDKASNVQKIEPDDSRNK